MNAPSLSLKDISDIRKLSREDLSDEEDTDTIDRIQDSTGDKVEHEAKLSHPDDDDAAEADSEKPDFKSDGMVQLGAESQKKLQDNVDALLNANHPSKAPIGHSNEDVDDDIVVGKKDKSPHRIQTLHEQTPWSEEYSFPSWEECQSIKDKADAMPDMIHVPFEEAVGDVKLEGWEDEWIAKGRFTGPKLAEPKIDFVYNCKLVIGGNIRPWLTNRRGQRFTDRISAEHASLRTQLNAQ